MCPHPTNKKFSKSKSGITAGRDVSLGDNTGQIAIGDYMYQFKIENPSSEALIELIKYQDQRRKFNEDIFKCYASSALPDYPPRLREFVTENRVHEINQALVYLQDHRILFLGGFGGIGKTTLVRALVETRPANVPIPFWFDFSKKSDATLGDILEKLAGYLSAPEVLQFKEEKKEAGQDDINRLTDELGKRDILWLIFDNLETALDDKNFHDPGIDSLFTSLRYSTHQAKIIITSRTLPILADGGSLIDVIEDEKQELKGLKTNFAVDYLVKNGLDKIEQLQLEELAIGVDGHPLALKLLVELIKKFGVKDTLNDLSTFQRHKEDTIKKARKLFDKLAGDEKELLEHISVFRRPESKTAIEKMFTATTSKYAIENLIDKSLLETDHDGNYWLHPLVREFAYDDLEDKIGAHKLTYKHYMSLPFDLDNFVEISHHLIKYREIIDDFVIDYFLMLPNDTYSFFIINEIIKQNKMGYSHKIFDLINKFIASKNDEIIISFILSYSYYFEDVYIIDKKASFEVYHKIIESYTAIKVFEAIAISVSSIANLHPSESLQIWKKLLNIDEQITEVVIFYISSANFKSNEYIDFLNDILYQKTNVSVYAKQMIINIFKNYNLIENYDAFSSKYYIDIKEHLKNIRNLSANELINYVEKNYKIINPPFTLEILSDLIRYDKPRVYKLIFHVIEYHAKTYRMIIFQVSEILCQSLDQEELDYINLFLKNKKDKYALLVGIQTLDLLSKKFEKEILIKYLIPILEHEDITIKKIANITKKVIEKNSHASNTQKKLNMLFRLLKTCTRPKNLVTMLKTDLFGTSPFVMVVWMWATKKTIENYNICEIYGVGKSTLKSSNPIIMDASLCIMNKLQTDPKKYIELVFQYAYKNQEKQVKFGSIPQFIFMGDREPEIIDRYLKEIMLDEDDDLVLFVLECLKIYKNQNYSNRNEMLNYLINHKNPDISGFSDYLLNGI